ncbi:MAG TPA: S53 family peptidase [Rhizomicrobium sp.]|nr:S53 family peptidase [Rhizomicrobium sp.]
MRKFRLLTTILTALAIGVPFAGALAQPTARVIDETKLVTLTGNTPPAARDPDNDRGPVPDTMHLRHMILVLRRPAEREAAVERYIAQLSDPGSPNYHRWLTAEQFGVDFGASAYDIQTVTRWLEAQGFSIDTVYPSRMALDFSGTAGEVREAFHTQIHVLDVHGKKHIGNTSDPRIPDALASVIAGIASLHDFHGHKASQGGPAWTIASCGLGSHDLSAACYWVTPPDLAKIYNFDSLFKTGNAGSGQTIGVIEDSDIYSTSDWGAFRSYFGLSSYSGSLSQVWPGGCTDPGTNADDFEAILDAEYATAAAPSATIDVDSCASTETTWGVMLAIENAVNDSPPSVLSVSYIWCEANAGSANQVFFDAFQQAAAEGTSVYVASGDEGAASCDYGATEAKNGIAVNGLASTPYDAAVGGTDFSDTYNNENATYWAPTNGTYYGSAKSYVPEMAWDDSCASGMIAQYITGSSLTYGSKGFCNVTAGQPYITTFAGGGGPSSCALAGAGGACKGYPKPSWQSVFGNTNDHVRDVPDVALFSASPLWAHGYIVCFSDPKHDYGAACSDFPRRYIYGYGTSFAAPIMAGMQALVDKATSSRQGNPDSVLYELADKEFGKSGNPSCNASLGRTIGKTCIFRDVREGGMDVPCVPGTKNCYAPSGTVGVLSRFATRYDPAYTTHNGWDFATGLGSVNAYNLVHSWPR